MDKLAVVEDRITQLEEHFEREKAQILQQIEDRGKELAEMLQKFKEEFDHDRELRLARDAAMVKQLTDHEHLVGEKFEKQIVS
jgi:cell shape-determining protein MreC